LDAPDNDPIIKKILLMLKKSTSTISTRIKVAVQATERWTANEDKTKRPGFYGTKLTEKKKVV
jgi:hypothetical protein